MAQVASPALRPAPRWRRLPRARPQQILRGAHKVFASRGLQGTVEEIAREANLNVGTIYRYFPSKEAVFTAMLHERIAAAVAGHENEILSHHGRRVRDVLRAIGTRAYRLFQTPEYAALIQMIFGEASRYPQQAELFYREVTLRVGLRVAALIRRGIAAGEFRPVDPLVAARGFMGMLFSFAIAQRLLGGDRVRPFGHRKVVQTLTGIYLDGLSARRPRARDGRGRGREA